MKKVIRLKESDLIRLVKKVINEAETKSIEGELNNPHFIRLKTELEKLGFKYKTYNEKGDIFGYLYSGKNPFKNYQHSNLIRNNIDVQYPYVDAAGGPIDTDLIQIILPNYEPNTPQHKQKIQIGKKYAKVMENPFGANLYDEEEEPWFIFKVANTNAILTVIKELIKLGF